MLTELRIKNFAIIESLTLPLARGFNVLSGETGAGKSIIVGALGLLLGERASADLIRTGADRATVEGVFDVADRPEIRALLDERGIDVEESTRRAQARGRAAAARARGSTARTVNAGVLAEVGRLLVNLHGQHEAQTLLDPEAQRRILDAFAGATEQAARVRQRARRRSPSIIREIADLTKRRADAERRADYLRHVVQEIEDAKLDRRRGRAARGRSAAARERRRAARARERHRRRARRRRGDGAPASSARSRGISPRSSASIRRSRGCRSRTTAAYYALEALARELEEYEASVDLDPSRLEDVRRRRDLLFRLTKKYGGTLAEVIETGDDARARARSRRLGGPRHPPARGARARGARRARRARRDADRDCARAGAERLARAVDEVLPDLGMPDGTFSVALAPLREIGPNGAEDVEFRVALNVGHEPRPLARVASGGELSRVMLALKTILARLDRVPTLVFDEVDAGIGGRVGLQVGETMRRVAQHHQVFAITHLPQIAARAHHHILVSKGARGGVTTADVAVLDGDDARHRDRAHARRRSGERREPRARARAARDGEHRCDRAVPPRPRAESARGVAENDSEPRSCRVLPGCSPNPGGNALGTG